jgi:hypothetical protein
VIQLPLLESLRTGKHYCIRVHVDVFENTMAKQTDAALPQAPTLKPQMPSQGGGGSGPLEAGLAPPCIAQTERLLMSLVDHIGGSLSFHADHSHFNVRHRNQDVNVSLRVLI